MPEEKQKVLQRRHRKIPFLGLSANATEYKRMEGFTEFAKSANVNEYSRKYIDEENERTDSTAMAPEYSYAFDRYTGDEVQDAIAAIHDDEIVGTEAVLPLLVVDLDSVNTDKTCNGYVRNVSIIPDSEGDDANTYTYSGSLKASGAKEKVKVTISEDGKKATIATETQAGA